MTTLQQQIIDAFLKRLEASPSVEPKFIEALRLLFKAGGKLKADDLSALYVDSRNEDRS